MPALILVLALTVVSCGSVDQRPETGPTASVSGSFRSPTAKTPTAKTPTARSTSPLSRPTKSRSSTSRPVIVIDPGHSGKDIRSSNKTGLRDIDYPNYPEIYEMFDVSRCVAKALRSDGYQVKLTKRHALSSVSHAKRAAIANHSKADLAISVHNDHGVGADFEATYDQRGIKESGSYHPMYRGSGSHRTVFDHPSVARKSQKFARIIARARATAQHRRVTVTENSFDGREPLEPGNLALVQLLSKVPWVYNEMGARTHGSTSQAMSVTSETRYAKGLLRGVELAVPLADGQANPRTRTAASLRQCLVKRVEPKPGQFTRPAAYLPYGF